MSTFQDTLIVTSGIYFRDNDEYVGYVGGPDDFKIFTAGNKFIVSSSINSPPLLELDPSGSGSTNFVTPTTFSTESLNTLTFKGDNKLPAFIGHESSGVGTGSKLSIGVNLQGSTGGAPYNIAKQGGRIITSTDNYLYEFTSKQSNTNTETVIMNLSQEGNLTLFGNNSSPTEGVFNCKNLSTAPQAVVTALAPNQAINQNSFLFLGKAPSSNNCAQIFYTHAGDSNAASRGGFGLYNGLSLTFDNNANLYTPGVVVSTIRRGRYTSSSSGVPNNTWTTLSGWTAEVNEGPITPYLNQGFRNNSGSDLTILVTLVSKKQVNGFGTSEFRFVTTPLENASSDESFWAQNRTGATDYCTTTALVFIKAGYILYAQAYQDSGVGGDFVDTRFTYVVF